ncbi:hypothetical protein V8E54_014303 [Elaphomyces granulatus]
MSTILMTHEDYTVAWICALPRAPCRRRLLPKPCSTRPIASSQAHNIVIECLPLGVYGIASAATVAANVRTTFPSIRFGHGLMAGIGRGVPSTDNDIRLGDVVRSVSINRHDEPAFASALNKLNAIARLHADEILGNNQSIVDVISNVLNTNVQTKPKSLFSRPADEYDNPPIIWGICDYSDLHKNKHWQGYAALAAAACTRILLLVVSVNRLRKNFDQTSQEGCWMVPFEGNPRFLGRHNEVVYQRGL